MQKQYLNADKLGYEALECDDDAAQKRKKPELCDE
jgi:hypothetical protein